MIIRQQFVDLFTFRGVKGEIDIIYGINDDPDELGFYLLDLPFDTGKSSGFPFLKANLYYGQDFYKAFFGWLQTIRVNDPETGEEKVSTDIFPMLAGVDYPFSSFGLLPTFFDAPGPNPPRNNESWTANTFLVFSPKVARTKEVYAIKGFEWGYELEEGRVKTRDIGPVMEQMWNTNAEYLSEEFPNWKFYKGYASG